jgi:hypothetical protein
MAYTKFLSSDAGNAYWRTNRPTLTLTIAELKMITFEPVSLQTSQCTSAIKARAMGRPSLSLSQLKAEPFVMYPREAGTGLYWQILDI